MSLPNLDNLVKTGQLKVESMNQLEFSGLLRSGEARLYTMQLVRHLRQKANLIWPIMQLIHYLLPRH